MSSYSHSGNSVSQPAVPMTRPVYSGPTTYPPQPQVQPAMSNNHGPAPQQVPATTGPTTYGPTTTTPSTGTPGHGASKATSIAETLLATVSPTATFEEKKRESVRVARELARQVPDWVTFFREVLGVDGVIRKLFTHPEHYAEFERSDEFEEIQMLIVSLRERTTGQAEDKEPTRVITVRLPKSLHESLRWEAHSRRTSMNKLCISKLLQVIEDKMIPAE